MGYTRTTWQDWPSDSTPITAAALNNIEGYLEGIAAQWQRATPVWTNLTVGTTGATNVMDYTQVGRIVICRIVLVLGTGGSASGIIGVEFPVASRSITNIVPVGYATYFDTSASQYFEGFARYTSVGARASFYATNAASTYTLMSSTSASVPMTWDAGDRLLATLIYEAAA